MTKFPSACGPYFSAFSTSYLGMTVSGGLLGSIAVFLASPNSGWFWGTTLFVIAVVLGHSVAKYIGHEVTQGLFGTFRLLFAIQHLSVSMAILRWPSDNLAIVALVFNIISTLVVLAMLEHNARWSPAANDNAQEPLTIDATPVN